MNRYIKEACVENLKEAMIAERKGADRLELCSHLELGGITPSEELIMLVKQKVRIPLRIMIRPRGGDFIYSEEELNLMKKSIEFCKRAGVEAVVFGILDQKHELDHLKIFELAKLAQPLKVVIHKAIDLTPDPLKAVKELLETGEVDTVLTSGGKLTANEGKEILKEMIACSDGKLEVMPAGKITNANLEELHQFLGARAYHGKLIVGPLN